MTVRCKFTDSGECASKASNGCLCILSQYSNMTDNELLAFEEYLYDQEVLGDDTWYERDQLLWEMNRRGLCSGK